MIVCSPADIVPAQQPVGHRDLPQGARHLHPREGLRCVARRRPRVCPRPLACARIVHALGGPGAGAGGTRGGEEAEKLALLLGAYRRRVGMGGVYGWEAGGMPDARIVHVACAAPPQATARRRIIGIELDRRLLLHVGLLRVEAAVRHDPRPRHPHHHLRHGSLLHGRLPGPPRPHPTLPPYRPSPPIAATITHARARSTTPASLAAAASPFPCHRLTLWGAQRQADKYFWFVFVCVLQVTPPPPPPPCHALPPPCRASLPLPSAPSLPH